ncbi:MAG: aromatic ring-hydroxylating dioxygenase subunit alpha [Alphaproteobacteria bacterium]|nr:aromatic ring-hydroxylating dioxygenase subunit alpha [Alphaproteobacteria bacterium]
MNDGPSERAPRASIATTEPVRFGREAYTDPAFLARENERLFGRRWVFAGLVEDAPAPGTVCPVDVAGRALLLARDGAGTLRVFHNFCRHRGMRLVDEARPARAIVCAYHGWSYALDGALLKTPHAGGLDVHDRAGLARPIPGLKPVRHTQWGPLVFVDLSGSAPAFEDHFAPLIRRWAGYDFATLRRAASRRYEIGANWKLVIENFIDVYHLPYVHPGLESYCAMRDHSFIHDNHVFIGQSTDQYAPTDAAAGALPAIPGAPEGAASRMDAFAVFPNLCMTLFHDNLRIIHCRPDGPSKTVERVEVFLSGAAAHDPALAGPREALIRRFEEFNLEDVALVERLQASLASSAWDGGHFVGPMDGGVERFQRLIARALAD